MGELLNCSGSRAVSLLLKARWDRLSVAAVQLVLLLLHHLLLVVLVLSCPTDLVDVSLLPSVLPHAPLSPPACVVTCPHVVTAAPLAASL